MKTKKLCIYTTLCIIGIAFGILNFLTPEYIDDYLYKFIFHEEGASLDSPITSLWDVFYSQYNHYFVFNGRVVVHTIVQLFSGLLGKNIFNIFNPFVFLLLVFLITGISSPIKVLNICFTTSLIFLLFPAFNDTVLWMTGSINYMWSSAAVCLFLYCIESWKEKKMSFPSSCLGLLWIIAGWSHEGITFPLALSLVFYMIVNYRTIGKKAISLMILGFVIGAFLCAFSPATLSRGHLNDGVGMSILLNKILSGVEMCTKLRAIYALLLVILVMFISKRQNAFLWLKNFYRNNLILCNAYILSFGLVFLSGFNSSRTAIAEELFAILLLIKILNESDIKNVHYVKILACVICVVLYLGTVLYSIQNYEEYKKIVSQIESKKSSLIITHEVELPDLFSRYVRKPLEDSHSEYYDCYNYNGAWNSCIAAVYHCDSLAFFPSVIYNDILTNNSRVFDIHNQSTYPFYVIPIQDNLSQKRAIYLLNPTDYSQLPFYVRPFATRMSRYTMNEVEASKKGMVFINGKAFLLIGKNYMIDDRLNNIVLK